ncbi:MAG TPA: hypothetical protein VFL79_17760 [Terriglobia bacterium]|nr:hypothetical protein [Terriglobia bacterium]
MKRMCVWGVVAACSLVVAFTWSTLARSQGAAEPVFSGGSYLTAIKDQEGKIVSRFVITLHADHTVAAIDSGQDGPIYYFGSQLGDWKPAGKHQIVVRTINFAYWQGPNGAGVVRGDYVINLSPDRRHVTGTITVTDFPLDGNPNGDDGILIASVPFEGDRIEPPGLGVSPF